MTYPVFKLENFNKWKLKKMSSIKLVHISFIDFIIHNACVRCLLLHTCLMKFYSF
jgi:hypothetical protein